MTKKSQGLPKKSPQFKPSPKSLTPLEQTLAMLDYMEKALQHLRDEVEQTGEVPPVWVLDKMQISATNLGMGVSYLRNGRKKEQP